MRLSRHTQHAKYIDIRNKSQKYTRSLSVYLIIKNKNFRFYSLTATSIAVYVLRQTTGALNSLKMEYFARCIGRNYWRQFSNFWAWHSIRKMASIKYLSVFDWFSSLSSIICRFAFAQPRQMHDSGIRENERSDYFLRISFDNSKRNFRIFFPSYFNKFVIIVMYLLCKQFFLSNFIFIYLLLAEVSICWR